MEGTVSVSQSFIKLTFFPVLSVALEAMLHVCLDRGAVEIDKFSRWLRAICNVLLARNQTADRMKALSYVEQAIEVIRESPADDEANPSQVSPSSSSSLHSVLSCNQSGLSNGRAKVDIHDCI